MLLVLLVPLWMILAWASLVFIVARHLYWWAKRQPGGGVGTSWPSPIGVG